MCGMPCNRRRDSKSGLGEVGFPPRSRLLSCPASGLSLERRADDVPRAFGNLARDNVMVPLGAAVAAAAVGRSPATRMTRVGVHRLAIEAAARSPNLAAAAAHPIPNAMIVAC